MIRSAQVIRGHAAWGTGEQIRAHNKSRIVDSNALENVLHRTISFSITNLFENGNRTFKR